ncbi:MAG: hypothetical protein Q7R95_08130 [bacterium]|nr:hypothetical protein [bacterium]
MKNFILGMIAVLIIAFVGIAAFQFGKQSNLPVKNSISPTINVNVTPTISNSSTSNLVGNEKDIHGCINSAGYSWCEPKNKCLRTWEEPCIAVNEDELIKQTLFKKNNWKESDGITITVSSNDGQYAKGSITAQGGGGYLFAAKVNGVWEIVADGNGTISCSSLEKYSNYPKTLIPECWDDVKQINVKR